MMSVDSRMRYMLVFLVISSLLFMTASCSHRSVRGTSQPGKGQEVRPAISDASSFSSGDDVTALDDALTVPDGQRVESEQGFLEQEPLLGEDGLVQEWSPGDSSQDYWRQREQAELMAAQVGLRDIFFEFDSWHLTNQSKRTLTKNAEWLKAHPDARVTIEGHCDERGTRAYNYVLGEKRAVRTRNYLTSLGVPAEQLLTMSYGKDNPVCKGTGSACDQQNRRAHLVLGLNVASAIHDETNEPHNYE